MNRKDISRYCKDCRNSFVKDDRNQSIACYDGNNFDFKTYTYLNNYASKCKWFEPKKGIDTAKI